MGCLGNRDHQVRANEVPDARAAFAPETALETVLGLPPPTMSNSDSVGGFTVPSRAFHPRLVKDIVHTLSWSKHVRWDV